MIKKLLIGLVLVLAGFAGFAATRPATYHVERSAKLGAPAPAVYASIADLQTFPRWSPWQKRDPAVKTSVSTPSTGVGAKYAWEGNNDVGKGSMTITETSAPSRVKQRLEFLEPWASQAEVAFDIKAEGDAASTVTWSIDGSNNFMGKVASIFMDMDKMLGKDFEDGLANLKRLVESKGTTGG